MDTDCNIDIILFNSAELAIWINQPLSSVEMGAGSLWWPSWSMNAKCELDFAHLGDMIARI